MASIVPADPSPCGRAPETMTRRADFVRASNAARHATPGFSLQARERGADDAVGPRVGYTCSRKVGNAVARNRAKRRLRALARAVIAREGRPGWDYVLVGRPGATASIPFGRLMADLSRALARVHANRDGPA